MKLLKFLNVCCLFLWLVYVQPIILPFGNSQGDNPQMPRYAGNLGTISSATTNSNRLLRELIKKKPIFYGQADRKGEGGGVNPLWPDRSICENFKT